MNRIAAPNAVASVLVQLDGLARGGTVKSIHLGPTRARRDAYKEICRIVLISDNLIDIP